MTLKKLTQAEKNKIRRKAIEAITDENYGDDGDNFHEHATAQAVISLLDELELKTEQRANWCAMAKKLGEDLDVAEKRIAELERDRVTIEAVTLAMRDEMQTATAGPVLPNGWVMMPIAPTEEMLAELCLVKGWTDRALNARYQAMLAAAPKPEA